MSKEWLKQLKVGDEVIVSGGPYTPYLARVEVADEKTFTAYALTFSRATGGEFDRRGLGRAFASPVTPELRAEFEKAKKRADLCDLIADRMIEFDYDFAGINPSVPLEQLERIAAILAEPEGEEK